MEKKKIFVVVIDEVCDMESYSHKPFAYDTEDKAKAKINELHEQILSELGSDFENDDWVDESKEDAYVELYVDGRSSEDHYSAVIYEVEVN